MYMGTSKNVASYWSGKAVKIEGIAEGTFTLTATILTDDGGTAKDEVPVKVVRLNMELNDKELY